MRRSVFVLFSIALLLKPAPAIPCIAAFGYTSTVDDTDFLAASVETGAAHLLPADEFDYVVDDAEYMVAKSGPVFIDLTDMIFRPNLVRADCSGYERGGGIQSVQYSNLRGNYQTRLDTFFLINAALFQGTRKVYGLVINTEANNRCVAAWKIDASALYVKAKVAAVAEYAPIFTAAGYGLRNTPRIGNRGAIVSMGFPVANGAIAKFPENLDLIAYWAYDIFDPGNPAHPANVNAESWTSLNDKLNQALAEGQKTLVVIKTYCDNDDPVEKALGVTCPSRSIRKLGQMAQNWRNYLLDDPRNLFVMGFSWTDFGPYGSRNLPVVWPYHSGIQQAVNCRVQ